MCIVFREAPQKLNSHLLKILYSSARNFIPDSPPANQLVTFNILLDCFRSGKLQILIGRSKYHLQQINRCHHLDYSITGAYEKSRFCHIEFE